MCNDNIDIVNRICNIVPIWAFQFPGNQPVIDSNFTININDQYITYNLRGVIYFGDHHYTSGMINKDGLVWFHDGIATGRSVIFEGHLSNLSLNKCKGKYASGAIYTQQLE